MDNNEKDDFDLQGRLGCFSLSDLLQTLSFTQKTGTLTLIQGWNTRTICFEQGRITYIAAATRLPSIVDLLIESGHMTVAQLEQGLGLHWKLLLGLDEDELALPEPVAVGAKGAKANGSKGAKSSNGHKEASITSRSKLAPAGNITDPYLHDVDGVEAFVAPALTAPHLVARNNVDVAQILLKHRL